MFCPKCGENNSADSDYCKRCATRLPKKKPFKVDFGEDTYEDIYTVGRDGMEDIYSSPSKHSAPPTKKAAKKKKKKKHIFLKILITLICLLLVFCITAVTWFTTAINKIERVPLTENLGISAKAEVSSKVQNIALFGLDSRADTDSGRSDAIIILSIDKEHGKIKMTSVARDSYVKIEGHGKDKLTHAWAYGKADLAVRALNENFSMNITDFVAVNFFQFAEVIDYIGGVTIDVDEDELRVMNKNYISYINKLGIKCDKITKTGPQLLSGGQALAYTRNRYTGGDIERGNRQKEVISAMIDKIKTINVTKYPDIINMMTSNCWTSLSNSDIVSICTWVMFKSPEINSFSIPNDACKPKGQTINRVWYYVYDLETATKEIHKFVYDDVIPEKDDKGN